LEQLSPASLIFLPHHHLRSSVYLLFQPNLTPLLILSYRPIGLQPPNFYLQPYPRTLLLLKRFSIISPTPVSTLPPNSSTNVHPESQNVSTLKAGVPHWHHYAFNSTAFYPSNVTALDNMVTPSGLLPIFDLHSIIFLPTGTQSFNTSPSTKHYHLNHTVPHSGDASISTFLTF
jgi:hypothetical protein